MPFTGIAHRKANDGHIMCEIGYRDGRRWGPSREWYDDGQISSEEHYAWDWAHGSFRQWHGNGRLAIEETYEWGVCLERKEWGDQGTLIEHYQLRETDPGFGTLQTRRAKFGNMAPIVDSSTPPPPDMK
jgi:antitoxin component YwqK of YwqJK toxin-antitoxin module